MKQESFERAHTTEWSELEALLDARGTDPSLPQRYRRVCRDLALAGDRGFGASLVDRLNGLALRGHQRLYGSRRPSARPLEFFAARFPVTLRREARLFALASLLFYGVGLVVFAAVLQNPDWIYSLMHPDQIASFEEMYDPAAPHYGAPRSAVGDLSAFAFYTSNNIGISLRTFAWGIFAGVGSLVVLVLNAVAIGAVAAHVSLAGNALPFFSFVVGHAAFELTAIVISAAAGMKIGWAWVAPGRLARGAALREAARDCLPLLYGLVVMLLVAAVIEAFWSSSRLISPGTKFAVGAAFTAFVVVWLAWGGREAGGGRDALRSR